MEENKIIIYQTEDGQTQIDVRLENDTVWLTQAQMVELFQTTKQNVSLHVGNVFKEGELEQEATVKEYLTVQKEGERSVSRKVKYYNLDVIISVGYRVKSKRGTAFRIWARRVLKDYLIKGYAVNERIRKEQIGELRQLVGIIGRAIQNKEIESNEENQALFDIVVEWFKAYCRQYSCCPHADDCGKPNGREGRHGKSSGKLDKSAELNSHLWKRTKI